MFNFKPRLQPHSFLQYLPKFSRLSSSFVALSIGIASTLLTAVPAYSAEQITISYGPAESSVSISEIQQFARAGEVTPILSLYGTLLKLKDGEKLRTILQTPLEASPWSVKQFLDTPSGKIILTRVGKVLKTDQNENGYEALKVAINKASTYPGGLTILGLLEEFPGESIRVDLDFSVELLEDVLQILVEDQLLIESVKEQAQQGGINNKNSSFTLPDPRQKGSVRWIEQDITFQNPNRDRPSPARVYLPQVKGAAPLIVISHGLGSDPQTFSYLAEHLASYGFAVAIPEHIDTSVNKFNRFFDGFENPPNPSVFANRPLDITALINELETRYQATLGWKRKIDFDNVGVLGQSFGGYTALAVGGAQLNAQKLKKVCHKSGDRRITLNISTLLQCRSLDVASEQNNFTDPRVKAVIAINPLTSLIFGEQGMSKVEVPTMMISGTKDYVTPAVSEQIQPYSWLKTSKRHLVLVDPGTHFSFLQESGGRLMVPPQLIGPDPNFAYPYLRALSLSFFETYLLNNSDYSPYISQHYIRTINNPPFDISLIEDLKFDLSVVAEVEVDELSSEEIRRIVQR
ncbi:MAG: alpha/beta hydrolase [Cyanobacteriota bacterium]|nr:alpha/beta hydrolase [Cyanobacteriota bacterium]